MIMPSNKNSIPDNGLHPNPQVGAILGTMSHNEVQNHGTLFLDITICGLFVASLTYICISAGYISSSQYIDILII